MTVTDVKPSIRASIKSAAIDTYYSVPFTLSAGTGTITWSCTDNLPEGLSFDSDKAILGGIPAEAFNDYVTVTAANSAGEAAKKFKLSVKAVKPSIATKTIPNTYVNSEDYGVSLDISGTKTITVTVTGLPDGLVFAVGNNSIIGASTKAGKFTVKVTASNAAGRATKSYNMFVYGPPVIEAAVLDDATAGKNYTKTFKASGTTPITWSVSSGDLPAGMTLNARSGQLKGKPSYDGTYSFTISASNNYGTDEINTSLTVKAIAPKINTSNLSKGTAGKAYRAVIKATGTAPLTWTCSGELPEGITFSDGTFSGTYSKYFKGNVRVIASNNGGTASKDYTLEIKAIAPSITTKTLSAGTVGEEYSLTLTATGTPDITWSWSGNPDSLTLDSSSGKISGTPEKTGSYRVQITAANDARSVKKTFTLKIEEAANTSALDSVKSAPELDEEPKQEFVSEHYGSVSELPEEYIIVAELSEISADVSGQYDFSVTLSDDVPNGAKLIYVANSETPSDDDAIAEFYDSEGQEIDSVPENHEIILSVWLNEGIIYRPVIAVKP